MIVSRLGARVCRSSCFLPFIRALCRKLCPYARHGRLFQSARAQTSSDWADVEKVYSLSDYVYAHENMGHVESMASRRHDPRAKPIEQLDAETGEVLKVRSRWARVRGEVLIADDSSRLGVWR